MSIWWSQKVDLSEMIMFFVIIIELVPRYKTLLLDLDETLVHTCSLKENPEHVIKTIDAFGQENSVFCLIFLTGLWFLYF